MCSSDDIHSGLNGIHSHVSTQISAGVQQNQTIDRPTVWEKGAVTFTSSHVPSCDKLVGVVE